MHPHPPCPRKAQLPFLDDLRGRLRYYIYSVCGVGRKEITRRAKPVSQCLFKVKVSGIVADGKRHFRG